MAALVVGGITVPVKLDGVRRREVEAGDRGRAFDLTLRSSVRAYKREWTIPTSPMARTDADALVTVLRTFPFNISGDIPGATISCHGKVTDYEVIKTAADQRVNLTFELLEV